MSKIGRHLEKELEKDPELLVHSIYEPKSGKEVAFWHKVSDKRKEASFKYKMHDFILEDLKKIDGNVFTKVIESSLKKWDEFRKTDQYKDSWEY